MIFAKQIKFVNELEENIFPTFRDVLKQFDFVVKDYVVNKQLFQKGIDGNKERLPGYSRTTIRLKISKGQPVDRTTLHDSEKFVASIEIDAFSDRFEVSSNVSYDKYIIKRYTKDVLKPTKENMEDFFRVYFLPNLKNYVNNKFTR